METKFEHRWEALFPSEVAPQEGLEPSQRHALTVRRSTDWTIEEYFIDYFGVTVGIRIQVFQVTAGGINRYTTATPK